MKTAIYYLKNQLHSTSSNRSQLSNKGAGFRLSTFADLYTRSLDLTTKDNDLIRGEKDLIYTPKDLIAIEKDCNNRKNPFSNYEREFTIS